MFRVIAIVVLGLAMAGESTVLGDEARHHDEIGKVTKIAPDSKDPKITAISLSSHGHVFATIRADASTKVSKGGDAATLRDIAVGDHLKAVVDDDESALSIEIKLPKKK